MKVIFTSNRFIDFLIRLLITAIVISPVIIWSWDTVKETTADGMLAAAFVAMGIALEFIQGWTGYRDFEVADMLADAAGVAAGWALAPPRLPNLLRGIEKFFHS